MADLDNHFASDEPRDSSTRAREYKRVLRVFLYMTAGYGFIIKTLVPGLSALLVADAGQDSGGDESISLLWILPMLLALSVERPAAYRWAMGAAFAGLIYVSISSGLGLLAGTHDFSGFSRLYYNAWVGAALLAYLWDFWAPGKAGEA